MASAVTSDGVPHSGAGDSNMRRGTFNLGTYATGGVAITAAQLGLTTIEHLDVGTAGGILFEWIKSSGLVKAYRQKDPAAAGGADIALPEVANAVDISANVGRYQAWGT